MGGHGALTMYLASKTKQYRSASAFAPISNPTQCPWGEKAFKGYLQGGIEEAKSLYDATELIAKAEGAVHILVDYVRVYFIIIVSSFYDNDNRALVTISTNKDSFFLKTFFTGPTL